MEINKDLEKLLNNINTKQIIKKIVDSVPQQPSNYSPEQSHNNYDQGQQVYGQWPNEINNQTPKFSVQETLQPFMIFEVIVIGKDPENKILSIKLMKYLCTCQRPQEARQFDKKKVKLHGQNLMNIDKFKIKGQILGHEIKEDFDVFNYWINFDSISIGDKLHAMLLRKIYEVTYFQKFFQIKQLERRFFYNSIHFTQQADLRGKLLLSGLGFITSFQIRSRMIIQIYDTNHSFQGFAKQIPSNQVAEQISFDPQPASDLDFHQNECNYFNKANYDATMQELQLFPYFTCNFKSNQQFYQRQSISYHRVRSLQNSIWACESLNEGIAYSKQSKFNEAIQFYDHAISLDNKLCDAFVAKGCALANLLFLQNQNKEALQQLEMALKLDNKDYNAQKYYQLIKKRIDQNIQKEFLNNSQQHSFKSNNSIISLNKKTNNVSRDHLCFEDAKKQIKKNH